MGLESGEEAAIMEASVAPVSRPTTQQGFADSDLATTEMYAALATTGGVLALFTGVGLVVLGWVCARRRAWLHQTLVKTHDRTRDERERARSVLDVASACVMALLLPLAPPDAVHRPWVRLSSHTLMLVIAGGLIAAGVLSVALGGGLLVLAASLI